MALAVTEPYFMGNAKIRVVGVGGAGNNAVERMISDNIIGIDFIEVNTDAHVLDGARAPVLLVIGEKLTKGLGAGGNPDVGRAAAEENSDELRKAIEGANMVFVTAGMGGGTGTGAAPVIAAIAKEMGILTVGVVTTPFGFELKRRMRTALKGIEELEACVDTLLVIPNEKLFEICPPDILFEDAFKKADEILSHGVRAMSNIIVKKGIINLDFNDIRAIMTNKGIAHMGIGRASGKNRAEQAAIMAINSQMLETTIKGAKSVLLSLEGDKKFTITEARMPAQMIEDEVDEDANLIYGAIINEELEDEIIVTLIATEFENGAQRAAQGTEQRTAQKPPRSGVTASIPSPVRTPVATPPASPPEEAVKPVAPTVQPEAKDADFDETPIDLPVFLTRRRPGQDKRN